MLPLEDAICGLVESLRTLGYEHTLKLELPDIFAHGSGSTGKHFQKFREKGRVMVSDTRSGKIIELTAIRFSLAFVTRVSDSGVSEYGDAKHCSCVGSTFTNP
jgi:hypothetical protein